MAVSRVNIYWVDSENDNDRENTPVWFEDTVTQAQIQAWLDLNLIELDQCTGSYVNEITVELALTIPAALKDAPTALYYNERGGLISFSTTGNNPDSFRIPAILATIMGGDSFNPEVDPTDDWVTALTTETTAADIQPVTSDGFQFVAARYGNKSQRK